MLYSARFVETLKVKATSLYNARARKRWVQCLLLSFSAAPSCLFPHAVLPYPPRHFALPATPLHLTRHSASPYPPRRFTLSPTPFHLIRHTILPYPQRHFALSPTPFFPSSPFDSQLQLLQTGHDGDKPQHAQMVLTALLPPL